MFHIWALHYLKASSSSKYLFLYIRDTGESWTSDQISKHTPLLDVVAMPVILALERQELGASLGYMARPYLGKQKHINKNVYYICQADNTKEDGRSCL